MSPSLFTGTTTRSGATTKETMAGTGRDGGTEMGQIIEQIDPAWLVGYELSIVGFGIVRNNGVLQRRAW